MSEPITQIPTDCTIPLAAITDAQVAAFFAAKNTEVRERHGKLCASTGFDAPSLTINRHGKPFDITSWKGGTYVSGTGDTVAEAEAAFVAKINARIPDPAKLRADAQALLAEAEKLEAEATATA